jgi:hypothetical protein
MPAHKKRSPDAPKITRHTLTAVLKPFKAQVKAASRKSRGKKPAWYMTLSDSLKEQIEQETNKGVDAAKMPDPVEIGMACIEFWQK